MYLQNNAEEIGKALAEMYLVMFISLAQSSSFYNVKSMNDMRKKINITKKKDNYDR